MATNQTGCGTNCKDNYPVGTTFTVTVPREHTGCHVSFSAGSSYRLVAGPLVSDPSPTGDCQVNTLTEPPSFTTSAFSFGECKPAGDKGALAMTCEAPVPECAEPGATELLVKYGPPFPESPGDQVDSVLHLRYIASGSACAGVSCDASIPVTIAW